MRYYYVYIMASGSRVLYTGVTNDLQRRVYEHQSGRGLAFVRRYGVTRLVYYEEWSSIREAISREKQIKGWLRAKKLALIESMNPGWRDLSMDWKGVEG